MATVCSEREEGGEEEENGKGEEDGKGKRQREWREAGQVAAL
jgi:hypothetical protein